MENFNFFEGSADQSRASQVKPLINKWTKTGLLEGLRGGNEKSTVAVLLENQAKQLIKEGNASSAGTAGAGYEQWHGVALPLVRRIFAEIAAKEFVSVQPMNLPSGLVFYLDFKYGTDKRPFGFQPGGKNQTGTLQGITSQSGNPSDGLYGAGRFGYSQKFKVSAVDTTVATGSVTAVDVYYDGNYTASLSDWKTVRVALPSDADVYAVRSFIPISASTTLTAGTQYLPAFTTITGSDIQFVVASSTIAAGNNNLDSQFFVSYSIQPTNDARTDFEYASNRSSVSSSLSLDTDLTIPEIELQMRSIPVTAKTRKLKASWTPEFAQDLNAYHSVDAEAELTSMLSEYVSMEIDLEILDMLINAAATTEYWSARTGQSWNGSAFTTEEFAGQAYIQGTWFQTLGTKLQKVSNQIHAKTLRGGANFLVCSPNVATILESIPGYAADTDGNKMKFAMGVQKVGSITSRYQVYKNPYMQENTVLMGFRGSQFLETGAVYAPYIPLMMTPLVYDPNNFIPRRGVMTRYAKVVTRPEFYGKVYVADLNRI
jgi:hypothetical protein